MLYKLILLILLFSVSYAENNITSLNSRDTIILDPYEISYTDSFRVDYYLTLQYSISSNIGNFGFAIVDEYNFNLLKNHNPYVGYCIKENMIQTSGRCKIVFKKGYRIVIYSMNALQNQYLNYNFDYIEEPKENIQKEGSVYLNPLSYFSWELNDYSKIRLDLDFFTNLGDFEYGVFDRENAKLFKNLQACKCDCCGNTKRVCEVLTNTNYELAIRSTNTETVQILTYKVQTKIILGDESSRSNTILPTFILLLTLLLF